MITSVLRALERDLLGGVTGELAHHLNEVRLELKRGAVPHAIRVIDRAFRTLPSATAVLAPIYARLMSLEDRDPDAALRLLQLIEVPDSEVPALLARAYLRLRRADDARRTLDQALRTFCVAADGALARTASRAITLPELQAPGWVGRGPSLELIGEFTEPTPAERVQVFLGDQKLAHPVRMEIREGRATFSLQAPQGAPDATVRICVRGVPLLGSGHRLQPDFALDGRSMADGDSILGWARLGWAPSHTVQLRLEDADGLVHRMTTHDVARPGYRWPFRLNPRRAGLRGDCISIAGRLPDGRWQPLPDTPLLLSRALQHKGTKPIRLSRWPPAAPAARERAPGVAPVRKTTIDVVIPVYRGCQETLACIESALATTNGRARILVIDDATPEAPLAAALDDLAAAGRILLMRNETNMGFVGSVNRALRLDSPNDLVLLNSDTLVFNDWLERLSEAAHAEPRIGTVTPLSNDGSLASYPTGSGAPMDPDKAARLDELAAFTNRRMSAEAPVGVGFCLYIRRDCLNEVGEFDAAVFGLGYGEEVDFCLRARAKNWTHRVAGDVFVYHSSGSSFGTRKTALLDRSQRLLNLRYPGYDRHIATYLAADPVKPLRRRLDEHRLASFDARFVVLLTLALEGGVERFVAERIQEIRAEGLIPLLLKPQRPGDSKACELSTEVLDVPNLRYHVPDELTALSALLGRLQIERIEIQHFLDIDARVIEAMRALNVPYEVMVHDYAWICPRVTLIDGTGRYCGEPAVSKCQSCVRRNGSRLGDPISVPALRARSAGWLGEARRVSAPSADTALRLRRYFPDLHIEVRPHHPAARQPVPVSVVPRNGKLRVGLIGAIGGHKGYRVLLDCARDAARRRLPLEFVVIGYTENDKALQKTGKVFITGRYSEVEVPHLVRREEPDLLFLPSVWPETWCYALDHALAAALPVIAFDLGAIAERLRGAGGGLLLPLDLKPGEINDRLLAVSGVAGNRSAYVQTLRSPDADVARIQGSTMESKQQLDPRDDGSPRDESSKDEGLSASVQVLPLPAGLYLFSVKAATGAVERGSGKLNLPAMHVGLGPGTRAEHVEFLSGPSTEGAWLFAPGDVLVAKVSGPGATLILTSVRSSTGDVLSIAVERLESRSLPAATTATSTESAVPTPVEAPAVAEAPAPASLEPPPARLAGATPDSLSIPLQVKTHIRSRGDMTFTDAPWAGRVAPGLWIESFSIQPLKQLGAQDVEYKGLTGTGFETPWLSEDQNCGTKGISVPLVGFAMRLKPGPATAAYECEYSGYYRSGVTVGPLRNGAPCRSMVANDPLEGIQVRIVKRSKPAAVSARSRSETPAAGGVAPSFGRYRDIDMVPGHPAASHEPKVPVSKADKRIKPSVNNGSAEHRSRPTQRSQNRNS